MGLIGGRNPVPTTASTSRSALKIGAASADSRALTSRATNGRMSSFRNIASASPRRSSGAHNKRTRTTRPDSARWRATTKPSPPLFPLPQMTLIRLALGYSERMKCATAEPAFSMSASEGTPKRNKLVRSISRISSALTIFIDSNRPFAPGHGFAVAHPWRSESLPLQSGRPVQD